MEYFAGLDISMDETHICVLDREGEVVRESKTASMAQAIADEFGESAELSAHRIRNGSHGADPVPLEQINAQLRQQGFYKAFPPPGIEVVSLDRQIV